MLRRDKGVAGKAAGAAARDTWEEAGKVAALESFLQERRGGQLVRWGNGSRCRLEGRTDGMRQEERGDEEGESVLPKWRLERRGGLPALQAPEVGLCLGA